MKTIKVLEHARKVLALRQKIVTEHVRQRNQTAVEFVQARETVSRQRLAMAQHRLGVIETLSRARQLTPPKPVDPVKRIVDRHLRTLKQLEARATIRAEVERQLRTQAAQAALDRAAFIEQVKRDVPEDLWEETIDSYDRRVYESGGGGES